MCSVLIKLTELEDNQSAISGAFWSSDTDEKLAGKDIYKQDLRTKQEEDKLAIKKVLTEANRAREDSEKNSVLDQVIPFLSTLSL